MFWDLLGSFVGAFAYAFIVYNIFSMFVNFVTRYKLLKRKVIITSFILSIFLTALLTEAIYEWGYVLLYHFPMLTLVFGIDYIHIMYQKCPHCAERIKADAFKCKHCHSIVNEQIGNSSVNS